MRGSEPGHEEFEETPPDPAGTIESLRSLGYSAESAVADLIDNSIAACASHVDVIFTWGGGSDSWCAVIDDGRGMTESGLREAMRIGAGALTERPDRDLGRFGFGLKTASFAHCRELTVSTRNAHSRKPHVRCWDLDHVRRTGRWQLRKSAPPAARETLMGLERDTTGTIVLWRRLDGLVEPDVSVDDKSAQRHFLEVVHSVAQHLAMTFGRYLTRTEKPLHITVNQRTIRAWDPFLEGEPAGQHLPEETLVYRGQKIRVRPFVLPHRSKLGEKAWEAAGGPLGWNDQQGFYVYRRDRLVRAGDWLGLRLSRDEASNLARISLDVPVELDSAWSIDVKKASVRPPSGVREDLLRIARETRRRSAAVHRHRGSPVGRKKRQAVATIWQQQRRHGELVFKLNLGHPLINDLLERIPHQAREVRRLLAVIEETIPVPLLPIAKQPPQPVGEIEEAEIIEMAELLYERFLEKGMTRAQAADRVLNCEPFDSYPALGEILGRSTP